MGRCKIKKVQVFMGLFMLFLGFLLFQNKATAAASTISPITIVSVDYREENIIVKNNGNSKINFATETEAAKGNWEIQDPDLNVDGTIAATTTIDISWLSPSAENILKIKGSENEEEKRVIILEKTKKLDISISYANIENLDKLETIATLLNIMSTAGTADNPIKFDDLEWKKGDGGDWKLIDTLTVAQLEKYQIMGTYLYFRIMAEKAIPGVTEGRRASNEVKVKIAKKLPRMVIGIDGEEFTADIRYGKEYRVSIDGGEQTEWKKITNRATKTVDLATIANDGSNGTTSEFPSMVIEIRDYATSKAASSKIKEIILEQQEDLGGVIVPGSAPVIVDADDKDIYISYNGIKNMVIAIPAATIGEPYEYTVVAKDDDFDITRVVWTSITKNTSVKILASRAVEGGTLYVRRKEIKSKEKTKTTAAVAYKLASTYLPYSINYPSIPVVKKESFTFTKGYPETVTVEAILNVNGKLPFETKIKSIKIGTRVVEFNDPIVSLQTGDPLITTDDYSLMKFTLKADSLKTLPVCTNRPLIITFENGTVDKTSIKLTINNPMTATTLTASVAPSTVSGSAITILSTLGSGNQWVYTITDTKVINKYTIDTVDLLTKETAFTTPKIEMVVSLNKYLTIYEVNATNNIVKYTSILITASMIN